MKIRRIEITIETHTYTYENRASAEAENSHGTRTVSPEEVEDLRELAKRLFAEREAEQKRIFCSASSADSKELASDT